MIVALLLVASPSRFAIVIGNNEPPPGLAQLRFADDDAARFSRLLRQVGVDVTTLSSFDKDTERRFGELPHAPVRHGELERAVTRIGRLIKSANKATELYFVYSGHASRDAAGQMSLTLADGSISHAALMALLARVGADTVHVVVDACHAEAVVLGRGYFDNEKPVKTVPPPMPAELPANVGVFIASGAEQEAFEWSGVRSGIFTHELLSGLIGAADVNLDQRIEYSELYAFVANAHRTISDPRALPSLIVRPPRAQPHAAIIDLNAYAQPRVLEGNAGAMGHFFVELASGERLADVNVGGDVRLFLPSGEVAFVRQGSREARISSDARAVTLDTLSFVPVSFASRGALDESFHLHLFETPFTASYYTGFSDSAGLPAVHTRVAAQTSSSWRRPLAIAAFVLGGASLVLTAVATGIAVTAQNDFNATNVQARAYAAADRHDTWRWIAIGAGVLTGLALVTGFSIWPWSLTVSPTGGGAYASASLSFD